MSLKKYSFDAFLSHSSQDKTFVQNLDAALREHGIRTFLDEKDIPWGGNIPTAIERAIDDSKHLIIVLSPDALSSEWVDLERCISLFRSPAGRAGTILPLLRRDCDHLPGSLRILKYIPVRNETEFESALPKILQALAPESRSDLPHNEPPNLDQHRFQQLSSAFSAALVVVRTVEDQVSCAVYSPDGAALNNTRLPVKSTVERLSQLQSEVAWISHRFGDEAQSIYSDAGRQIRDVFLTPQAVAALERADWIHFILELPYMDIPWELCAGKDSLLAIKASVTRSPYFPPDKENPTQVESCIEKRSERLRIFIIDTTGSEHGLSFETENFYDIVRPLETRISDCFVSRNPTRYDFEDILIRKRPNVIWIIGHQMENGIPLALWRSGGREVFTAFQLAHLLEHANIHTGLLLLDCCKTGGSRMSDETAFPTLFQERSNWCVIHPFGWSAMADSQVFMKYLLENLSDGHSLPISVSRARQGVVDRGGSGWWSTLLQGSLSSLSRFPLTARPNGSLRSRQDRQQEA